MNFRPFKAGDLVAEGIDPRRPQAAEFQTPAFMKRPYSDVWVSPARELGKIHGYVADVLIPRLITGAATSPALPRHIRFDDTGETAEERIEAGGRKTADQCLAEEVRQEFWKAYEDPPRLIPTEEN